MAFISRKTGQFSYFSQQVGDRTWRGKNVLDFGGNIGNILRDPTSTIDPERYWCLDVVAESVEKGKALWPRSNWCFYDRYCFFFNPHGVPRLPIPDLGTRFDYIVAYSVFTNTGRSDMLELVGQLQSMLAGGGALAFTYIDPHYTSWPGYEGNNFLYRLEHERGDLSAPATREIARRAAGSRWCVLVNGEDLYVETDDIGSYPPERQRTCHVFYTTDYMKELFPQGRMRAPVNGEVHHCCVIRKES